MNLFKIFPSEEDDDEIDSASRRGYVKVKLHILIFSIM